MIPDPIPTAYTVKAIAAGIICIGIYFGRKHAWLPATWLAFVLPLLPVLAFFQNGDQAYAARFTYLPSLGASITAAGLLAVGYGRLAALSRWWGGLVVTAILALLVWYAGTTLRLIAVWDNPGTLWSRVIAFEPRAQAYKERGVYHYNAGDHGAAVADFTEAISHVTNVWQPYAYNLYAHRGEALRAAGRYDEAVRDFTEAIELYPHPSYYYYRGLSLQALGRKQDAAEDFRRAGPAPGSIDWYWDARQDSRK
nr:tetratricopeptide repeat protein [Geomobilimonas luticola]